MAISMLASVAYLDIAIAIILLLGVLLGAFKGFAKTLKKSFIVIIMISLLLCGITANALNDTSIATTISGGIFSSIEGAGGEAVANPIYYNEAEGIYYVFISGAEVSVIDALQETSLKWLAMPLNLFLPSIVGSNTGLSLAELVANWATNIILLVGSFVLLCIVIKIVFVILNKIYQKVMDKVYILKVLDKLLGAIYSGLKSFIFVLIGMAIISGIAGLNMPGVDVLQEQINSSIIGSWLVENNLLGQIFDAVFK